MSAKKLNNHTSFSWLAEEIEQSRAGNSQPSAAVTRLGVPRLPANFSPDKILVEARHLRAVHLGEMLGSGVRAAARAVGTLMDRLFGHSAGGKAPRQSHEVKKAA